jgi:anaerobic ribonucleoside-triphosphate reductase activating protein
MRYSGLQVVFQEIPNEVSLAIHVVGCPLRCPGCHSSDLWKSDQGEELSSEHLNKLLLNYRKYITCVVFMGGEWHLEELLKVIAQVHDAGFKTALYTGLEWELVDGRLKEKLDYLKYGPFIKEKGGLSSPNTNQRLIHLKTMKILNKYFTEETQHGATN